MWEGRQLVLPNRKPSLCAPLIFAWRLTVAGNDPQQKPLGKRGYEVVVLALELVPLAGAIALIQRR